MKSTFSMLVFVLGGILMSTLLSPTPALARLAPYDGIGGNGGAPFRLDCGEYGILVGLNGRSGAVVDQVTGLCVKIDPVSGIWVGGVYETTPAGGPGGVRFHKICPVGQALTGIQGNSTRFQGNDVVSSLEIDCTKLKITEHVQNPEIKGWREIDIQGDPDPYKISALQDLCYHPAKGTGHYQRAWSQIGIALEGRAGLYVDHMHLICGSLPKDKNGYRVQFKTGTNGSVPEGTPLKITWRASGSKPELTPPLQYSWELKDWTHMKSGLIGSQPSDVSHPCTYAQQPCASSWFDSSSGSQIIFQSLPPAKYDLRVKVRPTVPSTVESEAHVIFEIRANQLASATVDPSTIRSGGVATITITLEGPAPPGGKKVYLTSSNVQLVPVPDSLTIPGGAKSTNLKLKADPKILGGQATIRASTKKPLNMAFSQNSQVHILGRGIPESDELPVAESQGIIAEAGSTPEPDEPLNPLTSNEAQQEMKPELDVAPPTENIPQDQEITERGITSFGKLGASKLAPNTLLSKPNQSPIRAVPDVTIKPPSPTPPGKPIPYPNTSVSALQPQSKISETVKQHSNLMTLPSESKEAIITVQNALFETKPFAVPNVPPLQK